MLFGAILSPSRRLRGQFGCCSQSLAGPFAAPFVPFGTLLKALVDLPNVCGTFRGPKPSKMTTKWAKSMRFNTPVGPKAQPEKHNFGPAVTPFWSRNGPDLKLLGHTGSQNGPNSPQNGLKTQAVRVVQGHLCKKSFMTHLGPLSGGHARTKTPQDVTKRAPGGQALGPF